jgi:hypothetical protein
VLHIEDANTMYREWVKKVAQDSMKRRRKTKNKFKTTFEAGPGIKLLNL